MKVTIYFIRHGESQANVIQHQTQCGAVHHLLMKDPTLTPKGVETCIDESTKAPKVDIILSSQLLRAIQTAVYTYPKRFVQVIPYLNELGTGLDNVPMDAGEQNAALGEHAKMVIRLEKTQESSFMDYLKKHILPTFESKDHVFSHKNTSKNSFYFPYEKRIRISK